jgi:hypothetical protein
VKARIELAAEETFAGKIAGKITMYCSNYTIKSI